MQGLLCLLFLLTMSVVSLLHSRGVKKTDFSDMKGQQDPQIKRRKERYEIHVARMVEIMVEFQKAQCYFMIATQIAALIQIRRWGLNLTTLEQAERTRLFLQSLILGGMVPITWIYLCLWLRNYRSSYILALALASTALAMAVYIITLQPLVLPDSFALSDEFHYPGCANVNPASFCLLPDSRDLKDQVYMDNSRLVAVTLCIVVLLFTTYDQYGSNIYSLVTGWSTGFHAKAQPKPSIAHNAIHREALQPAWKPPERYEELITRSKFVIRFCVHAVFLGYIILYFFTLLLGLNGPTSSSRSSTAATEWNFGQIVALFVWPPVIFQFAYLHIRESKHYPEHPSPRLGCSTEDELICRSGADSI